MKVIIGSRQTGRTTECIKYCITHAEKLDNGEYKPSLLVVFSEREKQRLIIDWSEDINNHLLKIITFADYIVKKITPMLKYRGKGSDDNDFRNEIPFVS